MTFYNPVGGTALLVNVGNYTLAQLFEQGGRICAKRGSGFVRLLSHGMTKMKNLRWSKIAGIAYP